jgi:hypothetical protein
LKVKGWSCKDFIILLDVSELYGPPRLLPKDIPVEVTTTSMGSVKIKAEKPDGPATKRLPPLKPISFPHVFYAAPKDGYCIFLLQLPDQLPILEQSPTETGNDGGKTLGGGDKTSGSSSKDGRKSHKTELTLSKDIGTLQEGRIGTINIMASGKTRFVLGENSFELAPGKPLGFRQVGEQLHFFP